MEARPWTCGTRTTYRYHPVGAKPINLGTDRVEAIRKVLDLNGKSEHHGSLRWVWESYCETSKRWAKMAAGTRTTYAASWQRVGPRLGDFPIAAITVRQVTQYVHIHRGDTPRCADIELALIRNLFKHGILIGVCESNPAMQVEQHGSEASDVMPNELVLRAFLRWLSTQAKQRRVLGLMAEYASLSGSRRCEFLNLTWSQVDETAGEIRTLRAKQRGKKKDVIVEVVSITPRMRSLLDRVRALGRDGPFLFPGARGGPYADGAFRRGWSGTILKAVADGIVPADKRFNFHALRRYYATMHKAMHGDLPDLHANRETTVRVYDATREVGRKAL